MLDQVAERNKIVTAGKEKIYAIGSRRLRKIYAGLKLLELIPEKCYEIFENLILMTLTQYTSKLTETFCLHYWQEYGRNMH